MVGPANEIANDHEIEVALGEAGGAKHLKLRDRIILAIAAAAAKRLVGRRPNVGAAEAL